MAGNAPDYGVRRASGAVDPGRRAPAIAALAAPHSMADLPAIDGVAIRRLLIVKLSALGDVVHALPVAVALRRRFPTLRITWAVEERWAPLLAVHGAVDRVVTFPRLAWNAVRPGWITALRRGLAAMRSEPYDAVLDLQGLLKSAALVLASRAPVRIGAPLQREGAGLVSAPVSSPAAGPHAVDEYLACAARLGAAIAPVDFGVRVDPAASASLALLLDRHGIGDDPRRLIAINPSASSAAKSWPPERWQTVVDSLADAGAIVLVGAMEQMARHAALAAAVRAPVVDLTGRTALAELVALLARSALHLAADTGSLHLAVALGSPVVGIYGPTSVERLGPYGGADLAIRHAEACASTCPRLCPRRRACLLAVTPEEVIARARAILRSDSPPAL